MRPAGSLREGPAAPAESGGREFAELPPLVQHLTTDKLPLDNRFRLMVVPKGSFFLSLTIFAGLPRSLPGPAARRLTGILPLQRGRECIQNQPESGSDWWERSKSQVAANTITERTAPEESQ